MIVIYGHRSYGRVEAYGGEHAQTRFAHIYYVPLFPLGSMWILGGNRGLPIKLHGKSVLAAYLRTWGLVAGLLPFFVSPGFATLALAVVLGSLSAWSWTWRSVHSAAARRRSDMNRRAFGTRCEPARLSADLRGSFETRLEERRANLPEARPLEDVARFGPKHPNEGEIAYGLLRLAELKHRNRDAGRAADRLLAGDFEALPTGEGPYRETAAPTDDASTPVPGTMIDAATSEAPQRLVQQPALVAALVLACGLIAAIGFSHISAALGAKDITAAQLADHAHVAYGSLTCDAAAELGTWQRRVSDDTSRVFACRAGQQIVLVLAPEAMATLPAHLHGELRDVDGELRANIPPDVTKELGVISSELVLGDNEPAQAWTLAGVIAALAGAGVVVTWLRSRRSRQPRATQA